MSNIIKDNSFIKHIKKYHEHKTKTILLSADIYNAPNTNFKWYTYEDFYNIEKFIYYKPNTNINIYQLEKELNA